MLGGLGVLRCGTVDSKIKLQEQLGCAKENAESMLCNFHQGEIAHNLIYKFYVWNWFYQLLHMIINKTCREIMGDGSVDLSHNHEIMIINCIECQMRLLHYTYCSHDSFTVTFQHIKNPITICLPYYRKRYKADLPYNFPKT